MSEKSAKPNPTRPAPRLVSEHHAGRRCRAAADHMLVGAADIRRYDLENDAVIDHLSCRIAEGGKVNLLNFDTAGFEVDHATIGIGSNLQSPLSLALSFISTCQVSAGALSACAGG
jgi:hypothetical protein